MLTFSFYFEMGDGIRNMTLVTVIWIRGQIKFT